MDNARLHIKQIREFTGTSVAYVRLPLGISGACSYVTPAYFDYPDNSTRLSTFSFVSFFG